MSAFTLSPLPSAATGSLPAAKCHRPAFHGCPLPVVTTRSHSQTVPLQATQAAPYPPPSSTTISTPNPLTTLSPGLVIEVWTQSTLRFAQITSLSDTHLTAQQIQITAQEAHPTAPIKLSFDEIISIWPPSLTPSTPTTLATDVSSGLRFLRTSLPRRLDTTPIYTTLRTAPVQFATSPALAPLLFPMSTSGTRERNAALTVATAVLLAADSVHFKRARPAHGWRALPASVCLARGRTEFVAACRRVLDGEKPPVWSRDRLDILRELEVCAASGSAARGTAATALKLLGYERTDDGAARLLLDVGYWATGSVARYGGGTTLVETAAGRRPADASGEEARENKLRDWTFPPAVLADARELRAVAREKRLKFLAGSGAGIGRRWLTGKPHDVRVYCVDEKSSRFLDDAVSVQALGSPNVVRICVHVTDVDQVVKSGSPIDDLARERGQSLYLPLKPLHMLPAAVMDAASFSATFPTEAISVQIDFDRQKQVVADWEVFASVVPPVRRFNYDQFDTAIGQGADAAQIDSEDFDNLKLLAEVAPLLADILDQRDVRRRQRARREDGSDLGGEEADAKAIASVRLVKRTDRGAANRSVKVAQVVDYCGTGARAVVGDLLTSAGALVRQFAKENRAWLPEYRGGAIYAARCGTAPLRRYGDLAIQRQVKCVLFGKQPAGRRRMDELRVWLAKRHSAGERTVAERRRGALFESLSNHCSRQCEVDGSLHAVVRGQVRNLSVSKKGVVKVEVALDGTGLSTVANVSGSLRARMDVERDARSEHVVGASSQAGNGTVAMIRSDTLLERAQSILPKRCKVRVQIKDVNTVLQTIQANVIEVLNGVQSG